MPDLNTRISRLTTTRAKPASLADLEKRADRWTRRWLNLQAIKPQVADRLRAGLENWTNPQDDTQAEYERCHAAYNAWVAEWDAAAKRAGFNITTDGLGIQ